MLQELQIKNFAIIEQASVSFGAGLNVLSGETGAGKSILLGALELILGAKPRANVVRAGEESAEVTALFLVPPEIRATLPPVVEGEELVITRVFNSTGRGKVYINGRLSTLSVLTEISRRLMSICGQNAHVGLLDSSTHIDLLDGYVARADLKESYEEAFTEYVRLKEALRNAATQTALGESKRAELEERLAELKAAELRPGIRAELESRVKRLSNAEALIAGVEELVEQFDAEQGIAEQLRSIGTRLNELFRFDEELGDVREQFTQARVLLEEFTKDLNRYSERIELSPQELEKLREQLAEVARLERKYRVNDVGLIELLSRTEADLGACATQPNIEELSKLTNAAFEKARSLALELSKLRRSASKKLITQVQNELCELSMAGAKLEVKFEDTQLCRHGCDSVEFLLSANRGEPVMPLREIASGGELSRIMLVLKKVLRDKSGINVLVFDEVDTGISGAVARAVGEKLKELAQSSQVLCITHLPQVASLADRHILVEKRLSGAKRESQRTVSVVRVLDDRERVDEVARMIAGKGITDSSRAAARELLGAS